MNRPIGIYIHIPFCRSKCPYCDFFSIRSDLSEYKKYVLILNEKIKYWGKKINSSVDSIYIGGGTPSEIGSDLIIDIINLIKENFNVLNNSEITIEANPASGKSFDFKAVKSAGVNRVSLGLQSVNENELKKLGRLHNVIDADNTIELIKSSGINNISLDIMLGIPEQTKESLKNTLDYVVNSGAAHISSYILKIEENTFYGKHREKFDFPSDELTSELYLYSVDYLEKNGFIQYEISNFSKQGFESKHNLKYWNLDEYLGIGPAAHSYLNGKRFYYDNSIRSFKDNIIIDEGFGGSKEEYIMLKLRLKSGLNISEYKEAFGAFPSEDFIKKIKLYKNSGFMEYNDNTIRFTTKGFLVSNSILSELI